MGGLSQHPRRSHSREVRQPPHDNVLHKPLPKAKEGMWVMLPRLWAGECKRHRGGEAAPLAGNYKRLMWVNTGKNFYFFT